MEIFLDFETRGIVDLNKVGVPRYVLDKDTVPLMLAYGNSDRGYSQWSLNLRSVSQPPVCPGDLVSLIEDPSVEFHAHNAPFEIYVWDYICVARWGWPEIPIERWYCTMARGGHANQPKKLDLLVKRLELPQEKDSKGKKLIQQLSKPTKAQVKEKVAVLGEDGKPVKQEDGRHNIYEPNPKSEAYARSKGHRLFKVPGKKGLHFFREDPDLMKEFRAYNVQDIVAEEAADKALPPFSGFERDVWLLDRKINQRGIPIDLEVCEGAVLIFQEEKSWTEGMADKITGGQVTAGTQVAKIRDWINDRVNFGETLSKEDVDRFLDVYEGRPDRWDKILLRGRGPSDMEDVINLLHLRQTVSGSAVAKYQAALTYASPDARCREQLLYYGAATGRWAGRGIQPHNFKRGSTPDETAIDMIANGDHEEFTFHAHFMGYSVLQLLSACVRGLIKAPEGKKLVVSDFAGIEGRVLHWLVESEERLALIRQGVDAYKHTATKIYGVPYDEVTKEQRQIGKAAELGLGYGMGANTFLAGALRAGQDLEATFAEHVVKTWRDDNPKVKSFWWDLDAMAKKIVRAGRRGKKVATRFGKLWLGFDPGRKYFIIRLPSGRNLYYFDPIFVEDDLGGQLYYKDGGKTGYPEFGGRITTYGGKLTENIVQAIARDLLCYSMLLIDRAGLDLIFHVHDEAVVETKEDDTEAFGIVHSAMETVPPWAEGLPLEAETYESRRYRK